MNKDTHMLIADVVKGDMDAFGELYDSLARLVFNYANTITRNRQLAEDVTHDVFLQTLKYAARIEKTADPVAYIMAVTRNHSYNMLKRENRFTVLQIDAIDIETGTSPLDRLLFEDAFSELPLNQREAVYLHLICGYTHKDVAAIQNAPLVTVKWRYGQALSKLRAYFAQIEEEKCDEHV